MNRIAFAVAAVLLGCCANSARAETLPLLVDVPGTYTPGTAFSFEVRVPRLADLASYQVELVFTTEITNPPLIASAEAAGTNYVFPSSAGFQSTLSTPQDSNEIRLFFSDSTSPPVQAIPPDNDRLAVITVTPGAEFTGPITISVGNDTLFDFNPEGTDFGAPEPIIVKQFEGDPGTQPVPAPAGALLLGIGGLLLGVRKRIVRRA